MDEIADVIRSRAKDFKPQNKEVEDYLGNGKPLYAVRFLVFSNNGMGTDKSSQIDFNDMEDQVYKTLQYYIKNFL